jgi:hypothetical protein
VNPNPDPCRQKRPTKKEKSEEVQVSFFEEENMALVLKCKFFLTVKF